MRDKGIMDFNELSDEESLELMERVGRENNIQKQLEIIFSYVGFDEEGYLGKYYNDEGGKYITDYGQEHIVCRFIEEKKCESVLKSKNLRLDDNLKNIPSSEEKLRFLNAHLGNIEKQVNANPIIFYGFNKTELKEYIYYPEPDAFQQLRGIEPSIHTGPFRGALLKGEGASYSKFKQHIHQLIDDENELKFHAKENTALPENIDVLNFENYLSEDSKKIIPFLKQAFSKSRPSELANMIFALIDLKYFDEAELHRNQTELINAINSSFNQQYNRQSLSYHFNKRNVHDNSQLKIISEISRKIEAAYNSKN